MNEIRCAWCRKAIPLKDFKVHVNGLHKDQATQWEIDECRLGGHHEAKMLLKYALRYATKPTTQREARLFHAALGYTRQHDKMKLPKPVAEPGGWRASTMKSLRDNGVPVKVIAEAFDVSKSRVTQLVRKATS